MLQPAVIACDVFRDELAQFAGCADTVCMLEMGLHDRPELLQRTLQANIDQLEQREDIESILLLYGYCGGGMLDLRCRRCRLVIPKAHDCIAILLGDNQRYESIQKKGAGTYFYSPGWIRGKRVPGPDRAQWIRSSCPPDFDEESIEEWIEADQEAFAAYHTAAYLDITGNAEAESYSKTCANCLGWKYCRLEATATWIRQLIEGEWDSDRFLVVEPGESIAASVDQIFKLQYPHD